MELEICSEQHGGKEESKANPSGNLILSLGRRILSITRFGTRSLSHLQRFSRANAKLSGAAWPRGRRVANGSRTVVVYSNVSHWCMEEMSNSSSVESRRCDFTLS